MHASLHSSKSFANRLEGHGQVIASQPSIYKGNMTYFTGQYKDYAPLIKSHSARRLPLCWYPTTLPHILVILMEVFALGETLDGGEP